MPLQPLLLHRIASAGVLVSNNIRREEFEVWEKVVKDYPIIVADAATAIIEPHWREGAPMGHVWREVNNARFHTQIAWIETGWTTGGRSGFALYEQHEKPDSVLAFFVSCQDGQHQPNWGSFGLEYTYERNGSIDLDKSTWYGPRGQGDIAARGIAPQLGMMLSALSMLNTGAATPKTSVIDPTLEPAIARQFGLVEGGYKFISIIPMQTN